MYNKECAKNEKCGGKERIFETQFFPFQFDKNKCDYIKYQRMHTEYNAHID